MSSAFAPPYVSVETLGSSLREHGHAVLDAAGVAAWLGLEPAALAALAPAWNTLPPDLFLRDGGRYRRRRHACFVVRGDEVVQSPHRGHWQPLDYNALHGGMWRHFEPVLPDTVAQPAWGALLRGVAALTGALCGAQDWFLEAHPFRIDTTDGIGRPTPEGAHRDGVDLVAVFLVGRHAIKGGESRVFDAQGPRGQRFTLDQPWSVLLLDDARVIHETTPIQPLQPEGLGWRDTLVVTCRAGGFQGDDQRQESLPSGAHTA